MKLSRNKSGFDAYLCTNRCRVAISVKHELILSMIDGKVCNVLSENKSTQTCFICKATKEMNSTVSAREPYQNMYQFGISSLHAYIRTMECLLNIAYRMNIGQWQVRGDKNKEIFKKQKEEIKGKFKENRSHYRQS